MRMEIFDSACARSFSSAQAEAPPTIRAVLR